MTESEFFIPDEKHVLLENQYIKMEKPDMIFKTVLVKLLKTYFLKRSFNLKISKKNNILFKEQYPLKTYIFDVHVLLN